MPYFPRITPTNLDDLLTFLDEEFRLLAEAVNELEDEREELDKRVKTLESGS